jgi:hypothetical protein
MKTLFLAWQHIRPDPAQRPATRQWYPIGRLDAEPEKGFFRFAYTDGARRAEREAGFAPLDSFPELRRVYESAELFPVFRNRVMQPKREDYAEYVSRLGLDAGELDPMEILAVSGGARQTDNFEVFPKVRKHRDGSFCCRFFLHGWRHVSGAAKARLETLKDGDKLRVCLELNNPVTGAAIQIQTVDDYHMLGWAPRYLIEDMIQTLAHAPNQLEAHVVRLNPPPAPSNQRVLIELSGRFDEGFEPMSGSDFQPLPGIEPEMA